MGYDVFIVDGDVFDPDGNYFSVKIENLAEDELSFLEGSLHKQSKHIDIVIRTNTSERV